MSSTSSSRINSPNLYVIILTDDNNNNNKNFYIKILKYIFGLYFFIGINYIIFNHF